MGRRKRVPVGTLWVGGDDDFRTMYLFLRVSPTGRVNYEGIIRKPYSNRPKYGGQKAVPWGALNP